MTLLVDCVFGRRAEVCVHMGCDAPLCVAVMMAECCVRYACALCCVVCAMNPCVCVV